MLASDVTPCPTRPNAFRDWLNETPEIFILEGLQPIARGQNWELRMIWRARSAADEDLKRGCLLLAAESGDKLLGENWRGEKKEPQMNADGRR